MLDNAPYHNAVESKSPDAGSRRDVIAVGVLENSVRKVEWYRALLCRYVTQLYRCENLSRRHGRYQRVCHFKEDSDDESDISLGGEDESHHCTGGKRKLMETFLPVTSMPSPTLIFQSSLAYLFTYSYDLLNRAGIQCKSRPLSMSSCGKLPAAAQVSICRNSLRKPVYP
jgi:hypothetical protein